MVTGRGLLLGLLLGFGPMFTVLMSVCLCEGWCAMHTMAVVCVSCHTCVCSCARSVGSWGACGAQMPAPLCLLQAEGDCAGIRCCLGQVSRPVPQVPTLGAQEIQAAPVTSQEGERTV